MKNLKLDLGAISRYRIQLMGLAAIMIIACHAPKHGVEMHPLLASTLVLGNLGVDLFIFLSGMGLWFSLSKSRLTVCNLKNWYKKRYKRLLIPYLIVMIPYWSIVTYMNNEGIGDFFIHTSTIGFWLWHEGAWFVAMLIPLYLITPPIYLIINKLNNLSGWWILLAIILLMLWDSTLKGSDNAIISNIHVCLRRFPPFIIGMGIAGWVKSGKVVELWKLAVGFILFTVGYKFAKMYLIEDLECAWLLLIPLVIVLLASVSLVKKFRISQTFNRSCKMMGKISLESYLTNLFFCTILVEYVFVDVPARYNPGNYVMYSFVIVFGILMAVVVNRLSDRLVKVGGNLWRLDLNN